jgi:hypothetical protein
MLKIYVHDERSYLSFRNLNFKFQYSNTNLVLMLQQFHNEKAYFLIFHNEEAGKDDVLPEFS